MSVPNLLAIIGCLPTNVNINVNNAAFFFFFTNVICAFMLSTNQATIQENIQCILVITMNVNINLFVYRKSPQGTIKFQ